MIIKLNQNNYKIEIDIEHTRKELQPAMNVQSARKVAEWTWDGYFDTYACSYCGCSGDEHWHFCPDCGAEMTGI